MEKDFEQLALQAKRVTLRPEEKQHMRAGILQFMETHSAIRPHKVEKRFYWPQLLAFRPLQTVALVFILVLLSGGGISLAAEGTMPGDTLYPMKIEINERIRDWAAITSEADVEWETRRAERRLEEVEKLAAEGRLDAKTSADIENRLAVHAKEAADKIAALQNDNKTEAAADASSRFETTLTAHERILERVAVEHTEAGTNMQVILDNVRATASTVAQVRSNAEAELLGISKDSDTAANVRLRASAESRQKIAETALADIRIYVQSGTAVLDEQAKIRIVSQIQAAEKVILEGKTHFEKEAYGKAFAAFQKSVRIAQEARLLVRARQTLKISLDVGRDDEETTDTATMMNVNTPISTNATSSITSTSTLETSSSTKPNASTTIRIEL